MFCKPAVKLTTRGRRSGGVICLVKNEFSSFVKLIDVKSDLFYAFLIDKSLFGTAKHVIYVCGYIPPEGSLFYAHCGVENGVTLLLVLEDFFMGLLGFRMMMTIRTCC